MKKFWNDILKDALLLYCGIFTVATWVNSIGYLSMGLYEDPNGNWREIDRAIIVFIGVFAFELCKHIKVKQVIWKILLS